MVTIAHSLGEASAENKGHGPETSRDADGQDRYSRHKALLPVAEGNTSTSRGAKTRQGRGRLPDWLAPRACRPRIGPAGAFSCMLGEGTLFFRAAVSPGRMAAWPREEDVWTLVRVPVPNVALRPGRRAAAAGSLPEVPALRRGHSCWTGARCAGTDIPSRGDPHGPDRSHAPLPHGARSGIRPPRHLSRLHAAGTASASIPPLAQVAAGPPAAPARVFQPS